MKIEFNWYTDQRTNSKKLQLLDSQLNTMATLDQRDFNEMNKQGKNPGQLQDVVDYCNEYKATQIEAFTPTVF